MVSIANEAIVIIGNQKDMPAKSANFIIIRV